MRTKITGLLGCLVAVSLPVLAADFFSYEQLTVAASSVGITTTTVSPAGQPQNQHCQAVLETAQIRYRADGTAPTSTVGTPMNTGDVLTIDSAADALRIRFIRTGATSGVLNIHCHP